MVALDVRMIEHTGIGTYLRNLVPDLVALRDEYACEFAFVGPREKLVNYKFCRVGGSLIDYSAPIYSLRQALTYPRLSNVDLYHFPHYDIPLGFRRPFVVTVHDVIPLVRSEFAGSFGRYLLLRHLIKAAAIRSRLIFVPAQWVKKELIRQFHISDEKIRVVPYAPPATLMLPSREQVRLTLERHRVSQPFFLCVSLDKPHKNLRFLIRTFLRTIRDLPQKERPMLVVLGLRSQDANKLREDLSHVDSHEGLTRLRLVDEFLPEQELAALYASAVAVVQPSFLEGFGMPIVEAQKLGTPVLVSDLPWAHETAGDAALFFSPVREESLKNAFLTILTDDALRQDLIRRGKANIARFDWKIAAHAVLEGYRNCCGM